MYNEDTGYLESKFFKFVYNLGATFSYILYIALTVLVVSIIVYMVYKIKKTKMEINNLNKDSLANNSVMKEDETTTVK